MKNIFILLLFMGNISKLFAQPPNSAIFTGGNNDGFDKTNFTQAGNNIFNGGSGDGWDKTNFIQSSNNIFTGGSGDGWDRTNFVQAGNNIFNGGNGDGWDKTNFIQSANNIFIGGNGDGWDSKNFAQTGNNIFLGGQGDGWASAYRPLGPLPVTILSFTAIKYKSTSSFLQWVTSQELNSLRFDVEHSNDAMIFTKIGSVAAAGNSSVPLQYSFIDNNPVKGMNYYRLKQVDLDGHFIYTPARLLRFDEPDPATVKYYPNPTGGIITAELSAQNANELKLINIINAKGEVVNQLKLAGSSGSKIQIDMSQYAKGIYFVQLRTATLNSTERIVLQ